MEAGPCPSHKWYSEDVVALVAVPESTAYAGFFALGLAGFAAYRRFRS